MSVSTKKKAGTPHTTGKGIEPKSAVEIATLTAWPTIEQVRAMAKAITAKVRARLDDRITPESLARGILFEAAWASVECETRLRALNYAATALEDQHRDFLHAVELWEASKKATEELNSWAMPLAERGAKFIASKRGLNRLSNEVLKVLQSNGADLPAKDVLKELQRKSAIDEKDGVFSWRKRSGASKTVTMKQFEKNISRLRKRVVQ